MKKNTEKLTFFSLNIIAAILLFCLIGYLVLSRLETYTQHGEFIVVPAFHDLTEEEALEMARHTHLRIEIIDSLYDEDSRPGVVLEQSPLAGQGKPSDPLDHQCPESGKNHSSEPAERSLSTNFANIDQFRL